MRPRPVTTKDTGVFDTSKGTVYLVLGNGGTAFRCDEYDVNSSKPGVQGKVTTFRGAITPVKEDPNIFVRAAPDATEDAVWSAKRDPSTGYGIAVFDVDPGTRPGGQTSITVTEYHALGADIENPTTGERGAPNPHYTKFDSFTLVRPRSD